jgi:probable HAF family extracellular repeat protein
MNRRIAWLLALCSASAAQAATYSMVEIGVVGGLPSSVGRDINEQGDVLAEASSSTQTLSFVYKAGAKTTLPGFVGETKQESAAYGFNTHGQVVGVGPRFIGSLWRGRPFIAHKAAGPLAEMSTPITPFATPRAINDAGNQVGSFHNGMGDYFAYFYADGARIDLGSLGGVNSWAVAINGANAIAGAADIGGSVYRQAHAMLYQNGGMQDLGSNGAYDSFAADVNDQGWVVGTYNFADNAPGSNWYSQERPFLYKAGKMYDFGLSPNKVTNTKARGINNGGQVVGQQGINTQYEQGIIYENERVFNLNALLHQDLASDWYIEDAIDVNNAGQIVATARHQRLQTRQAVLLNPWDGSYATTYPNMHFRGTPNGWGAMRMTKVAANTWQAMVNIAATGTQYFKFDATTTWGTPFGEVGTADGIAEQNASAANMAITTGPGDYRIIFNDATRRYSAKKLDSCIYNTLYYRGTTNSWANTPMQCVGFNTWRVSVTFSNDTHRFKFDEKGDWSVNYGDSDRDDFAELGGADILASDHFFSSTYPYTTYVYFNEKTKRIWVGSDAPPNVCAYPVMYIRGTLNNWGTVPMACIGPNTYRVSLAFDNVKNPQFKFDPSGNWSVNFGENNGDGIADASGNPINLPGPGRYVITYNDVTRAYTATLAEAITHPTCNYVSLFVRGTLNRWGLTPMRCAASNTWRVEVDVGPDANKRFKFDAYGDWATSWGDNAPLGVADLGGVDIVLPSEGRYRFEFNDSTRAYTATRLGSAVLPVCQNPTMYFRGTPGSFAPKAMTCVRNNEWELTVTFGSSSSERFKFDLKGDWSTNWGDNNTDGFAELSGADIRVFSAGVYRVKFNESTKFYQVTQIATP